MSIFLAVKRMRYRFPPSLSRGFFSRALKNFIWRRFRHSGLRFVRRECDYGYVFHRAIKTFPGLTKPLSYCSYNRSYVNVKCNNQRYARKSNEEKKRGDSVDGSD